MPLSKLAPSMYAMIFMSVFSFIEQSYHRGDKGTPKIFKDLTKNYRSDYNVLMFWDFPTSARSSSEGGRGMFMEISSMND